MNSVIPTNLVPINTLSGYDGVDGYFVAENGTVWSNRKNGSLKLLKPAIIDSNKAVWVYNRKRERKCVLVAHLVAKAFIPNITNSQRVCFKTDNRDDCSASNLTWEREKKIKERTGIEKDIIMLDDEVVKNFKKLYEAMKIKGYPIPTSNEFISSFLEEAMESYINKYGLRRILYSMDNG